MDQLRSVAIYARISSDPSGQALGVARQLEDCRKLAAERGWGVAEEYVDNDVSAYSGKTRPSYQRMVADIEQGRRDGVVVYNLDRLTRRPVELEQFAEICERAGVRQLATVTADVDLGTDDGMFMARIFAAFAAKESARKSERLRRKARQNAEAGKPGGGANRPFGYEPDKLTVNPVEAELIRQAMRRVLAGESVRSVAVWMDTQGVPTSTGAEWRTPTLRAILLSPRIAGLRSHLGEVVGPAIWDGIITLEERQQLLNVFAAKVATGRRTPRSYLLSGMLRCGKCGGRLFSSARQLERRYVCLSGPDHGGCGGITVTAPPVEEWIAAAVLYRLDTPQMGDTLTGRRADDARHSELLEQLTCAQAKMAELASMWADGDISRPEWKAAREPLEHRIKTIDRQLSQITGSTALEGIVGHGQELRTRWEGMNLQRQAAIVAAVLDHAVITPAVKKGGKFDPNRIEPVWTL
ncbi:recombinase family protein [Microterricola viridarii]|uniref:Site-specific DNA recombinase n=1 Tax=Microterricola viridarii TaxID=412690 RepID=A0A1H1SCQ0_9MICO|nr:recombinase family protein [Microterricola viridarii]SDS45880.1 Site-specific DNA recombinase [Microterricola viridarii]